MIEDVITPAVPVAFLSVAGLAAEQQVAAADIGRFGASARLEALKQIMRRAASNKDTRSGLFEACFA